MKYPKQKDQHKFMGKQCTFTKFLYRDITEKGFVKWIQSNIVYSGEKQTGWIVGFGCTYNGRFKRFDYSFNETYFSSSKRVEHIKVRIKPDGKVLKVPASNVKIIKEE